MEFLFLLSFFLVVLPFGYQVVYGIRIIYRVTKKSILDVLITSLCLQIALTILAFFIGAWSFNGECGLPVFGIIGLGMMSMFAIIIIAIIQFIVASILRNKIRL